MTLEEMHARHLTELGFLEDVANELGLSSQLVERGTEVPYHTLLVQLEADDKGRPRQLALNFYPLEAGQLDNTLLLQYFIALPFELADDEAVRRVAEILPDINNKVVLGHFGITAGEPQLHYRYVQALREDDIVSSENVGDVLALVGYTPLVFQDTLQDVTSGSITVAEAKSRIEATYSNL